MSSNVTVNDLPAGMTITEHERSVTFAKLASQAYSTLDIVAAETGMSLFTNIPEIKAQDFSTPDYVAVSTEGSYIDWIGTEGLDYTLFENQQTGDLVISFRGTEPLSLVDWAEDIEQAFGGSEQYEQAVALARSAQSELDQYNLDNNLTGDNAIELSFTGHSLGGGLATAAALASDNEAIVFDAAGLSQPTIDALNLDLNNVDQVTNFNVQGDMVSDFNGQMDYHTIGSELAGIVVEQRQYGDIVWLEGVDEQADFGSWLMSDDTWVAEQAEAALNHAWHVVTYQLENLNFV